MIYVFKIWHYYISFIQNFIFIDSNLKNEMHACFNIFITNTLRDYFNFNKMIIVAALDQHPTPVKILLYA